MRSRKSELCDLPEVTAGIELVDEKTVTHEGHEYKISISKYTMYKNYRGITVAGGPHKLRAHTTCKTANVNKAIKRVIMSIKHK